MKSRRTLSHVTALAAALAAALSLSACVTAPPPPPPPHHAAAVPPDWFHQKLALARHARTKHAYYAIMAPVCEHVAKSGPDKYRARCKILIENASIAATKAAETPPCDDDDRHDTPAQITACSD